MIFEIWKPVIGYEGIYSVSDLGRVRRECGYNGKIKDGFKSRILKDKSYNLYPRVTLSLNNKTKCVNIHILVMEAFIGPRPKGFQINHKDGIRTNSRLSNLEYCTAKQNIQHAHDNGLCSPPRGEESSVSKLKEYQVREIRDEYSQGNCTLFYLASKYGVSYQLISKIINNRLWKHVENSISGI